MPTGRTLTSAFAAFSSAAPSSLSGAARRCTQCQRTFSSYKPLRVAPRRQLQTSSTYHPMSLHPAPPPPRNVGIPDTSIAGYPRLNDTRPPSDPNQRLPSKQAAQPLDQISIPEREAQIPKPVEQKSKLSARPRRFNFGPKKAAITLTKPAVDHLRRLLDQPEPKLIRIGTKAKGCSGLAYDLQYVDKPSPLDETVEQDGVKVLIDNKALMNIIGSEMDWIEDKLQARFVFKNPNITEQCGCGESFSVR